MEARTRDPQQLAELTGRVMYARDAAAQEAGIELLSIGPGQAQMAMTVRADMMNGHGVCHGGRVFMLADTAFAYACNSYNAVTLAVICEINFLRPSAVGARLTATARERSHGRTLGVYDIDVRDDSGQLIAIFRGTSYTTGKVLAAPDD